MYDPYVTDDTNGPEYGTVTEAIEVLAMTLPRGIPIPSKMTVRRAGARGDIATLRRGRNVYFDLASVRSWAATEAVSA